MSFIRIFIAAWLVLCVAACGSSGDGGDSGAGAPTPVGSAGGQVRGGEGVVLDVPSGALQQTTTLQIAPSDSGAPPLPALPAGSTLHGPVHALTPHGTTFSVPVEVSLPRGDLAPGAPVWLLKTNENGTGWQQIEARVVGDRIVAPITSFSYMVSVRYCTCAPPQPPVISVPPRSGEVDEGGYVLLSVDALGPGPLSYQWWRGNASLRGETGRGLVINPVTLGDDGMQLSVEVTGPNGLGTRSAPAVVRVRPIAPQVAQQPQDVQARVGGAAVFTAGTTSGLVQALQWQRSDDGGVSWTDVRAAGAARLVLPAVAAGDDGALLRLRADNAAGSVLTRAARLTVLPQLTAPAFVSITPDLQVPLGQGASFVVQFDGAELEWAWERQATSSSPWAPVPGADAATLTLPATTLADDGARFRASARNGAGSATSPGVRLAVQPRVGSLPRRLAAGPLHSLGLANDGRLWGWGGNHAQQLAPAARGNVLAPLAVGPWNNVVDFAAGSNFNLVLLDSGVLYGWGGNAFGQAVYFDNAPSVAEPQAPFGTSVTARAIAAGPAMGLAMGLSLPSPTLAWGIGFYGDGQRAFTRDAVPVPRRLSPDLVRAALGGQHALGIAASGGVVAWGYNGEGQLGLGDRAARLVATPVPTLVDVVDVAVGELHSMALTIGGDVLAWGGNTSGQLGGPDTDVRQLLPRRVPLPAPALAMASGRWHALALTLDGRLFAWGAAQRGQVGHGRAGASEIVATPREITAGWALPLRAVAAGDAHSLVLDAAGVVWAWGANDEGQLGDGTRTDRAVPAAVPGLSLGALR